MLVSVQLECSAASPAVARRAVVKALGGGPFEELGDTVALLVSELVTNAVLHARTAIEVVVRIVDDALRVEVLDGSRILPQAREYGVASGTGRGLRLVESLARAWGADRVAAGKVVWFELRPGDVTDYWDEFDLDSVDDL